MHRLIERAGRVPALLIALAMLIALDLARPYAGSSIRPLQFCVCAVTVLIVWAWRRAREGSWRAALPTVLLAAFIVPTYLNHSRDMESDGMHYYVYLRSLVFDGDLDLTNDYLLFDRVQTVPNVLPIGAPLLWSPLVLTVHAGRELARLFGAQSPAGVEPLYQNAAALATLSYGVAGLFLLQAALRRWSPPWPALWTTLLCWIGSPLRFYLAVMIGFAHGCEFFAATCVLHSWLALRDRVTVRRALFAGAASGVAFLVRSQDAILVALPVVAVLAAWRCLGGRLGLRALAGLAGGFALAALPQLLVWQAMFGVPVLVPHTRLHGAAFMNLRAPQLAGTLVSPGGGLLTSYPAMGLALIGLILMIAKRPRAALQPAMSADPSIPRRDGALYALSVLPIFLVGWYVNATIFDWYQVRRFTGLVPLLAPGLATILTPLARAGFVPMLLLCGLFLRYDLAIDTLRAQPGEPAPVRSVMNEMADSAARNIYGWLEPRAPHAAARWLTAYGGEVVLDTDDEVTVIPFASETPLLRLPRPARNLSGIEVEEGVACRWVRDRDTRIFLATLWNGGVIVTVRARALETIEPQFVELRWNEMTVGRQPMTPSWADYRFHVPASAVRSGTNVLCFSFDRSPIFRRARGVGPREVRPAAIAAITLHKYRPE